ncbi:MAG: bifunctional UDP-3-O-[3-hydroxymyristoyl] N-acetylglucosamine deacetylase/3-hydroxyacyl-ACP dehydratase [Bacteroidota bacterium]|nr:bifunctional UDP-3-O-[3-hydroxymyristoyl] N-acetylglucosamine deacetylase/3-hydroxyacyl-ACP dehydratase [Bacteroidota bacterium]MDP4234113.1 bifunctional UDP-3-O-[3-hydroxymyristoyl] N-acetylglucosamine deacetylase/3-hydroxyacyl-ACP dehydratase [Bacteroidota bacterium]MDP4243054.1 bifunctional UDP-3-O-[3-hydroxymyristoyl] N-acetylglucosamine deacetylase/3-hydroxyacyl-ACP dehydratase [Bacteroidota bacterium]MDP4287480.1 bifunctional UDP-3-O-[3-hydroxymyristoyl] N-acetylglucosamine deacetylase/
MRANERTISHVSKFEGIGLHTGNTSSIEFHPAPEGYGIRFVRSDLPGKPEIPALVDYVSDISRGTTLTHNNASVHTVEHVLAAVVGLEIDNIRIELTANEPPIGDGSAEPYVEALLRAGFTEQTAPRKYLVVDETVSFRNEAAQVEIVALPLPDDYRVTVMIDYNNPVLGSQHTGLFSLEREFVTEFAKARTFCFLHEVEMLYEQGLIKGGNVDNAIVIVDRELDAEALRALSTRLGIRDSVILGSNGMLNDKQLHYKNEPARHKLLDLLGDLALAGAPLQAQILAARPGHASNVEFARKLRKLYEKKALVQKYNPSARNGYVFDITAIERIMPHRYPMLLVDRILSMDITQGHEQIVGLKNVTYNEPFFMGHFPGKPVMPGVLILEAMAQTGGMLLLNAIADPEKKLILFMAIDKAKFRKPVTPGDQLIFELTMLRNRGKTFVMSGIAKVEGQVVAEAELMAAIVDR